MKVIVKNQLGYIGWIVIADNGVFLQPGPCPRRWPHPEVWDVYAGHMLSRDYQMGYPKDSSGLERLAKRYPNIFTADSKPLPGGLPDPIKVA